QGAVKGRAREGSMTEPVQRVSLTHLQIPLKEPICTARGEVSLRDAILVTVETSGGVGVGEASPGPAVEACWDDLAGRIAPGLLGRSFTTVEDVAGLAESWAASSRAASAGAETACWDLLGQARHAPLAELLGASSEQLGLRVESGLALGVCAT